MNKHTNRRQKKKHIMVVDDNEDMRSLLGQLLEKAGYGVIFADNGQTSLIQAKLYHPALILMDLSLPDLSGWEAVGQLRKMSEFRTTPIIAVTAHISTFEIEHARAAGCSAHIGKPFDTNVLLRSIARLLNSH
jgi:two-component system, cell cycle response regulator DivK